MSIWLRRFIWMRLTTGREKWLCGRSISSCGKELIFIRQAILLNIRHVWSLSAIYWGENRNRLISEVKFSIISS